MTAQIDRYKLHQFYNGKGSEPQYFTTSLIKDDIFKVDKLQITGLSRNLPASTPKSLKQAETDWIRILPQLDNVNTLSVRHRPKREYFEAICQMKNLEELYFAGSPLEDLTGIDNLQKLTRLGIGSFTRLTDISPIAGMTKLTHLSIENSFKIQNYQQIGNLAGLIGLRLEGDFASPKNLRLPSLLPYKTLSKLKHLNLSLTSIIDNSYEAILSMTSLERFDTTAHINKAIREKIKNEHKTLKAGFFMDWDYDNKKIYPDKSW